MCKGRLYAYFSCLLFLLSFVFLSCSKQDSQVKDLVEKNIQAAGGKEKISQIKNFSFKAGPNTYYVSSDGRMKITVGKDPIITEIILTADNKVIRNCYNKITEFEGLMKSNYQAQAKLRSGLFTLANFKEQLEFHGLKSFGPKEHYMLTTQVGALNVEFYLDLEEFTIKRVVFKGFEEGQGRFEVNLDFGLYQEIEGIKIPSSWFRSQVGARGREFKISDVNMNQALDEDFFSNHDVNVGNVEITQNSLKGNVVDFSTTRADRVTISTNWTKESIQSAGFKANDKLILEIGGKEIEIDFYDSQPPKSAYEQGAKLIMPDRRGENFMIYILSSEYKDLAEKLELLLPIQIKRK